MSQYIWGDKDTQFFFELGPNEVLDAIDRLGLKTTGRCLTLNSMENRVYEVEVESKDPDALNRSEFVVAKFYRPGRWSREQILDEHQFMLQLEAAEVPVVAPLTFAGETLFQWEQHELWYALFPRKGGRVPMELNEEQLQVMGRMLARLHNVGAMQVAAHRITISPDTFGLQNLKYLQQKKVIPMHYERSYAALVEQICEATAPTFKQFKNYRIHGDCHWGNIIWRDGEGPFFIDFDDMLMGPAVQDVWLIIPGSDQQALQDRALFLEAYESMRTFDYQSLKLVEPLRALRYIHFSAWIAKRWEDPSFKHAFPFFGTEDYWQLQVSDLQHQWDKIQQPQAYPGEDY